MVTFNSVSIGNKAYLITVTWNCTIFVAFIKQVSNLIDPSQPPPPWAYCFVGGGPQRMLLLFKILNEQKKGEWCENNVISWKKRHIFKWNMVLLNLIHFFIFYYALLFIYVLCFICCLMKGHEHIKLRIVSQLLAMKPFLSAWFVQSQVTCKLRTKPIRNVCEFLNPS